jgi:NRPS condensation-like uncharacterized protein
MSAVEQTTRLNVLDELYLHLDREEEPWSVHLEIRVEGTVDRGRLESAVRAAAARHPIIRARLRDSRLTDVRYHWEIAAELEDIDLEEVECASGEELSRARERLLSRVPALDRPGPFALLLAHRPGGDVIVLNLHHAAGDGLSALRFMGSIARAYGGEDDPLPAVDPIAVRDVGAMSAPGSLSERLNRGRATVDYLTRGINTPTRIAARGQSGTPGYGFALSSFEPEEVQRLSALRSDGATVNDVLLGGLALAVRRWNERHGVSDADTIYLMMPINLRPPEWRYEIVGNFASYVSVRINSRDQTTIEQAVKAAAGSTRRIKDGAVAGLIVELFNAPTILPTGLKQRMQSLIPLTGNVVVDTAVLSNLGRVVEVPTLGDAGAVSELWFSPPGRMPLGASMGAATLSGRLFVTLRYRHALFGQGAASEFLATFKDGLLG